jgi:cytochrome c-type biogenesis protein CcmH/NrfG
MSGLKHTSAMHWTRERAALLALACLVAGTAGGWSIRGLRTPTGSAATTTLTAPAGAATSPTASQVASVAQRPPAPESPAPARLKEMADAQAAPLREKLKADPFNPDLLSALGNLYYDAQQYPVAVDYYARALKSKPDDAAVRTDMGTAFWFMGNADRALGEFDKALAYAPNNPNTLFNLGMVKWKGKNDAAGAIAAWEKLLASDPNYQARSQVEQMLAEVKSHGAPQPIAKAD